MLISIEEIVSILSLFFSPTFCQLFSGVSVGVISWFHMLCMLYNFREIKLLPTSYVNWDSNRLLQMRKSMMKKYPKWQIHLLVEMSFLNLKIKGLKFAWLSSVRERIFSIFKAIITKNNYDSNTYTKFCHLICKYFSHFPTCLVFNISFSNKNETRKIERNDLIFILNKCKWATL